MREQSQHPDSRVERAVRHLQAGGVVVIPTDTVYGIAASMSHPDSIERLLHIKSRPTDKTIPVLVSEIEALNSLGVPVDARLQEFLEDVWPGPITVVLDSDGPLPAPVVGPGGTIGVRMPDHSLARAVIERAGGAIACTSANRSGAAPACRISDLDDDFIDQVDYVFDVGETAGTRASAVVAIDNDAVKILRKGPFATHRIESIWKKTALNSEIVRGSR